MFYWAAIGAEIEVWVCVFALDVFTAVLTVSYVAVPIVRVAVLIPKGLLLIVNASRS